MMRTLSKTWYKLTVRGNAKIVTVRDSFTTVGSYILTDLGPHHTAPTAREVVVEEESVNLTEYYDPNTAQLIEYVNKLAAMYNRQHLVVGADRQLKALLNYEEVKQKWDILKGELMRINPMSAFDVIQHNDREIRNLPTVLDNIRNTHFMHLLLYAHGPAPTNGVRQSYARSERDRLGVGFYLPVATTYIAEAAPDGGKIIYAKSALQDDAKLDTALIKKATGQEKLNVNHLTKGEFRRDAAGRLTAASMEIYEQVADDYKTDLYLALETVKHEAYG